MCDRETGDAGTERLSSSQSEVCFQTWASQARLHTRPRHGDDGPSRDLHGRSTSRSGPRPWPPLALTLDVSYEWHHTACGLWRLASLAEWHALKAHPRSSVSKFPSFSRLSNAPLQGQTTCCVFLCSLGDRQSLGVSPLATVSTAAVDTGVHVLHILVWPASRAHTSTPRSCPGQCHVAMPCGRAWPLGRTAQPSSPSRSGPCRVGRAGAARPGLQAAQRCGAGRGLPASWTQCAGRGGVGRHPAPGSGAWYWGHGIPVPSGPCSLV